MQDLNRKIGRFQLLALLGEGGFASVYRAEDTELGREVAIKLLHPQLARNEAFLRRFRAEARAAARLRHPHIVDIYDVGTTEDGRTYLVMELLQGTLLSRLIRGSAPRPPERSIAIITQLAAALDYLHAQGLVHRDLKPANVMVDPDGNVTLMDFGIARSIEDEAQMTETGQMIGTPVYMAPEQITAGPITAATDIYALGILAYELFSGRPPFTGSPTGILHDQIYTTPPPIRQFNPSLLPSIARAIDAALSKDPALRPRSAGEFAASLTGVVKETQRRPAGPPPPDPRAPTASRPAAPPLATPALITAAPLPGPPPAAPWNAAAARNRYRLAALIGVPLAILALALAAFLLTRRHTPAPAGSSAAAGQPATLANTAAATAQAAMPSATAAPTAAPTPIGTPLAVEIAGLPQAVHLVAEDRAAQGRAGEAGQDLVAIVDRFRQQYALTPQRPLTFHLIASDEANAREQLRSLGFAAVDIDNLFAHRLAGTTNDQATGVVSAVYLPFAADLRGTLAFGVASYTLRTVGGGAEKVDAYPAWFLRGFEIFQQSAFSSTGYTLRNTAVKDVRANTAPSLAAISTAADARKFTASASEDGQLRLDARGQAAVAYLAGRYGEAFLNRLIHDAAFGTITQFNAALQRLTGMTLDQLNAAVNASLQGQ